jgi:peptidylprolyl isomerase
MSSSINADACAYCFIDLDLDNYRNKLAIAAAFCHATDSRYGFSSKDLRHLGGSEVARIPELMANDHEWASKSKTTTTTECGGGIVTRPPPAGHRIVVRLFWDVAPLACENFATLCANGSSSLQQVVRPGQSSSSSLSKSSSSSSKPTPAPVGESGKPLTYRGSTVHRVIPGFVLQGGDFVFGNGSGGESIFGKKVFKDERAGLQLKHDRRGILSMGNSGKNSNSSQFFLTFDKAPQCDGKHVIFGELVSGMEVLDAAEQVGTPSSSTSTSTSSGEPSVSITITDCGIYQPLETPGCGYWYDTPDPESFSGISPVFMVRPRVVVLAPTAAVLQKFVIAMGTYASVVAQLLLHDVSKAGGSSCEDDESSSDQIRQKILELLGNFSADVVVIAPASYKSVKSSLELPKSWQASGFNLDEVVLEAKPVEALSKVRSQSWLAKRIHWQLDGNS